MDEASRSYVQMDELMDGVGKRLAELTRADWGIVTAGCCAALTHFTTACIAGTNPERMQRLPDLTGFKDEVIIPEYSRNVYDHAIRMVGVKVIEVKDPSELEAAFNERTALVYILAGPGDTGPLGTQVISDAAKRHNVPVIVDAAAEILTIPNVHLQRGATAVAYSGGKCIRGPQAAGLLLGDKNLLQAAWANSAPHHAFGRSLKVGKEEIMGMLAATEMWTKRDHDAEWKRWQGWLEQISTTVKRIDGVTTRVQDPEGLSNRTPSLRIEWDGEPPRHHRPGSKQVTPRYGAPHCAGRSNRRTAGPDGKLSFGDAIHDDAGRRQDRESTPLRRALQTAEIREPVSTHWRASVSSRPMATRDAVPSGIGSSHLDSRAAWRFLGRHTPGRVCFRRSQWQRGGEPGALSKFAEDSGTAALLRIHGHCGGRQDGW